MSDCSCPLHPAARSAAGDCARRRAAASPTATRYGARGLRQMVTDCSCGLLSAASGQLQRLEWARAVDYGERLHLELGRPVRSTHLVGGPTWVP